MLITRQTLPALRWEARRRLWILHTETESLYVDEETYHRILVEQLAQGGIEWKTWTHYISPAEAAWERQCQIERCVQAKVDLWRGIEGVTVVPRGK